MLPLIFALAALRLAMGQQTGPAAHIKPVTALPAKCKASTGDVVALYGSSSVNGVYSCPTDNTWVATAGVPGRGGINAGIVGTDSGGHFIASTAFQPLGKTGTYQVAAADFALYKTIVVSSGSFTITLVANTIQPPTGQLIRVINYGAGTVTIARSGQTINGGTGSLALPAASATAPTYAEITSDGTNYFASLFAGAGGAITINGVSCSVGGSCTVPASVTIASGATAMGTSAISPNVCATVVTVSATGVLSTDVIGWTPNADVSGTTGYGKSATDGLIIYPYPTADNVNFAVCNATGTSITPGAITLNWRVVR